MEKPINDVSGADPTLSPERVERVASVLNAVAGLSALDALFILTAAQAVARHAALEGDTPDELTAVEETMFYARNVGKRVRYGALANPSPDILRLELAQAQQELARLRGR